MLIPFGVFSAGAGGGASAGAFELISTTLLSSSAASVNFNVSGLGSSYKHLQIRYVARDSGTHGTLINTIAKFNSSASGYYSHYLGGDGSSVASGPIANTIQAYPGTYYGGGTSNIVGSGVIDILDPFSTNKNKTIRTLSGVAPTAVYMSTSLWANTSAVTSFEIFATGTSFGATSRFSIYGIKGA